MKLLNHPCLIAAQPLMQTAQRGHRSASPGVGRMMPRAGANRKSIGRYLVDKPKLKLRVPIVSFGRSCVQQYKTRNSRKTTRPVDCLRPLRLAAPNNLRRPNNCQRPRNSMLYPAYTRLVYALGAVRTKCNDIRLAIRAHCKEMRGEGR